MSNPNLNTPFRIRAQGGNGYYLTISGGVPLSNNRSLYLSSEMQSSMQLWKVIASNGAYKIISCADESYALNYYWINGYGYPGPCDVYPHSSNEDAMVVFSLNGQAEVYKIKQQNTALFLTPSSYEQGASVSWSCSDGGDVLQYWSFEPSSAPIERKVIDLPNNRFYNWNQFYTGITEVINSTEGCAWTCGLDVANLFGPSSFSPSSMTSSWNNNLGYLWTLPTGCLASFGSYVMYSTQSEYYSRIRYEINNNCPLVVGLSNCSGTRFHFVVAYGYTGNGNASSLIKVFDPAQSPSNTYPQAGRDTTLDNAIGWNSMNYICKVRPVVT